MILTARGVGLYQCSASIHEKGKHEKGKKESVQGETRFQGGSHDLLGMVGRLMERGKKERLSAGLLAAVPRFGRDEN